MRILILIAALGVSVATSYQAEAKASKPVAKKSQKAKAAKAHKAAAARGKLSTNVNFEGADLHGQYQTPEEALVRVENEKGLSDLIGVRKHFKDRLVETAEQE